MKVFYDLFPFEELIEANINPEIYKNLKLIQDVLRLSEYDKIIPLDSVYHVEHKGRMKPYGHFVVQIPEDIRKHIFQLMNENNLLFWMQ